MTIQIPFHLKLYTIFVSGYNERKKKRAKGEKRKKIMVKEEKKDKISKNKIIIAKRGNVVISN